MSKLNTRSAATSEIKVNNVEAIEDLINKVCTSFVNQLEANIDKKFSKIDSKLNEVNNTLKDLTQMINSNKSAIETLDLKYDQLEQNSKSNCLRFTGFPEDREEKEENVMNVLLTYLNDTLKVSCSPNDIDNIYRIGKANRNKSRTILVKFLRSIKRNEVINARKLAKGSGITIYEDLTKERYNLLQLAKKKHGSRDVWCLGGRIFVQRGDKRCLINSLNEL